MRTPPRPLTPEERAVVVRLLGFATPIEQRLMARLEAARVTAMDDGGMGSLVFCSETPDRAFGREIARGHAQDVDGVWLSIALNVDTAGELFELDIFKGDFSPTLKLPSADKITPSA